MDHRDHPTVVTGPATFRVPLSSPPIPFQLNQHHERPSPRVSPISSDESLLDAADRQCQMEESLKRSVTVVFWYKANTDPIRLHQEISTFPFFQLSHSKQLVADLKLPPSAYIDAYNPHTCTWEQQTLSVVRVVDSEQRLLYRTRHSLLEGLTDRDCPGLPDEVAMQQRAPTRLCTSKRLASDMEPALSPMPPNKYYRMESYPGYPSVPQYSPTSGHTYPQAFLNPRSAASGSPTAAAPQYSPTTENAQVQLSSLPSPHSPYTPAPAHFILASPSPSTAHSPTSSDSANAFPLLPFPGPALRRWPNDFTVAEIAAGFRQMEAAATTQPALTQRVAFERVFGCKYVKSTVCRHKALWAHAPPDVRDAFEKMGADERAMWSEFVRRVDDRVRRPPKQGPLRQEAQEAIAPPPIALSVPMLVNSVELPPLGVVTGAEAGAGMLHEDEPVLASFGPSPDLQAGSPRADGRAVFTSVAGRANGASTVLGPVAAG